MGSVIDGGDIDGGIWSEIGGSAADAGGGEIDEGGGMLMGTCIEPGCDEGMVVDMGA